MEEKFYNSKTKMVLAFIFLTLLTIGSFYFAIILALSGEEIFMMIFTFILAIILILCTYTILKRLIKHEPIVILSKNGITLNGPGNPGFVPWEDFEGFVPYKYQMSRFLGIILKNEEHYIDKLSGRARKLVGLNQRMGFPPFNISLSYLKNENEFFEALEKYEIPILIQIEEDENL